MSGRIIDYCEGVVSDERDSQEVAGAAHHFPEALRAQARRDLAGREGAGEEGQRMKKWKFPLGTSVAFDRRYTKVGWINPENDDPRVTLNDETGRASVLRWEETKLEKPMTGIVVGVRKITLANWVDWVGDHEEGHWETVQNHLEGQVYLVAVNMSRIYKVAEAWMVGRRTKP